MDVSLKAYGIHLRFIRFRWLSCAELWFRKNPEAVRITAGLTKGFVKTDGGYRRLELVFHYTQIRTMVLEDLPTEHQVIW